MKLRRIPGLAILLLSLLLSACGGGGTADGGAAGGGPERSLTDPAAVPEEEAEPGLSLAEASIAWEDLNALGWFLCGTWTYAAPDGEQIELTLDADGSWQGARTDGGGTVRYAGQWRLERVYAGEDDLPDLLCLDLSETDDGDWQDFPSAGEFLLGRRSVCGGRYMMCWDQANNGESLFSWYYNTFNPVVSRPLEDGLPAPSPDAPRTDDHFYAVCWRVDDGTVLWLDDLTDDTLAENAGRRVSTPYSLAPDADLRCSPDLFAPGGFAAEVETNGRGEIAMLNWASTGPMEGEEAPLRFDQADPVVDGLSLGMTREQVREALGEPSRIEDVTEDSFLFGPHEDWDYDGMNLSFYDLYGGETLTLGSVLITGENIRLSNGLRVGYTAEEVLASWYSDGLERPLGGDEPWGCLLYGDYLFTWETGYARPAAYEQTAFRTFPDAAMNGEYYITYTCYTPAGENFEQVDLTFYIDGDDAVTDILWSKSLY